MKITLNSTTEKPKNLYPYIGTYNGSTVYFTTPKTGVLLVSGQSTFFLEGDYSTTWCEDNFIPFHGTVTIDTTK